MTTLRFHAETASATTPAEPLAPGEAIEVYFWSQRRWRAGRFLIDCLDRPYIAIPGRAPLRFEAAMLMGMRRIVH